jgi:archaellum component FlaC
MLKLSKFLKQSKFDLNQKDMKEVSWMLQKLREGVTTCFLNLGSLFYSKDEREVQNNCNSIVTQIKDKLKLQRGHSLKLEDKLKDLAENHSKEADDLRKKLENAEGEVENLKNQILEVSHKKNYFSKLCDKQIEDLKEVRKHFNQSKTHNEELVNDLAVAG